MKLSILIFTFLSLFTHLKSQDTISAWSLQQCIEHARENNLAIQQQRVNARLSANIYQQRRYNLLPNLNLSSGFTTNMGRVRNEVNFEIIDVTTQVTNVSIASTTPIFEGFARRNSIEQGKIDWDAALKEVEKAENEISINIAALYIQILLDRELLESGRQSLQLLSMQVERIEKLVEAGSLPHSNLLEIRALAARETASYIRLKNNLELSLLDLAQALDLESPAGFDILTPVLNEISETEAFSSPEEIFEQALMVLPQVSIARLSLESNLLQQKIARGYLYPRLSFLAGWGSSVSRFENEPDFNFNQRFRDNAHSYLGLRLSIPVFNNLEARTGVKNASLGVESARVALERQKLALRKEVQQATADAEAALRQYLASRAAAESYNEAFRYMVERYNVGLINTVDFNISKTESMNAESGYIQAKYAYLLRLKILDFYKGIPLVL